MIKADDFSTVDIAQLRKAHSWQNQYRLLMEWGNLIQPKPAIRLSTHQIKGCATPAWLVYQPDAAGNYVFLFDSDSRIINGLTALLLAHWQQHNFLQNNSPQNSALPKNLPQSYWSELLRDLGLHKHLTPSRNNGFQALVRKVYELAE